MNYLFIAITIYLIGSWVISGILADRYALQKRVKELDKINSILWTYIPESDYEINQKIKAFSPKPGAWTIIRNSDTRIKILKANIIKEKDYQKKDKLKIGGVDEDLEVRCGKDFLKIKIQNI